MSKLLQRGRLTSVREDIIRFTASIKDDVKRFNSVVSINQAHAVMMLEEGIVNRNAASKLLQVLSNAKKWKAADKTEDVHMLIKEEVTKLVGDAIGGNLHIGKSKNDQVAASIRMVLRDELVSLISTLVHLQQSIPEILRKHILTIVPGYTHTQPAQPITSSHYLISYFDAFFRDLETVGNIRQGQQKSDGSWSFGNDQFSNKSRKGS